MEGLLTNNIFFVFLLGILVILNYDAFDKKQKISIIYACSFGLTFNSKLNHLNILLLLVFILFLYEEYLNEDIVKIKFVSKIRHKCADFLYMYIVLYKIHYIVTAIILKANITNIITSQIFAQSSALQGTLENVLYIISILLLVVGVHKIFNNPVELNNFKQIYQKFSEIPYYTFRDSQEREILFTHLELVTDIEDYSFLVRKRSYCSWSLEFVQAVLEKKKSQKATIKKTNKKWFEGLWRRLTLFVSCKHFLQFCKSKNKIDVVKKRVKRINIKISVAFVNLRKKCIQKIKRYLRGYSTIEMQLIRILSYKKGLKMGMPHSFQEAYLVATRKFYENMYAPIFFVGLKKNLNVTPQNDYFRYYIIYIYLHTVQTKLNGHTFRPLDKIFGDVDVADWPLEALFIIVLGLNSMYITKKRIDSYMHIVDKYQLDLDLIYQLVECIS